LRGFGCVLPAFVSAVLLAGQVTAGRFGEDFGPGAAILFRDNHALVRPVRLAVPHREAAPCVCVRDEFRHCAPLSVRWTGQLSGCMHRGRQRRIRATRQCSGHRLRRLFGGADSPRALSQRGETCAVRCFPPGGPFVERSFPGPPECIWAALVALRTRVGPLRLAGVRVLRLVGHGVSGGSSRRPTPAQGPCSVSVKATPGLCMSSAVLMAGLGIASRWGAPPPPAGTGVLAGR
jgi:hypothetical protein